MSDDKGPVARVAHGSVKASVWKNENKGKNGEKYVFYSVSLQRSYKDKDKEWQNTTSLRSQDIMDAQLCLTDAYRKIGELRAEDRKSGKDDDDEDEDDDKDKKKKHKRDNPDYD